jgi:hypothetical protein
MLPDDAVYGGHLTYSGRQFLVRTTLGLVALLGALVALVLLKPVTWRDVLAGAVLAWSTAALAWARNSYRDKKEAAYQELRRLAELDLILARLNQIGSQIGVPPVHLDQQVDVIMNARMERLAHFTALDEFRFDLHSDGGYGFWDETAIGEDETDIEDSED